MAVEKFPQHESLVGEVDPTVLDAERQLFNEIMAPRLARIVKVLELLRETYEESSYDAVCARAGTADPDLAAYFRERRAARQKQA